MRIYVTKSVLDLSKSFDERDDLSKSFGKRSTIESYFDKRSMIVLVRVYDVAFNFLIFLILVVYEA